jgi:hypothetical protein
MGLRLGDSVESLESLQRRTDLIYALGQQPGCVQSDACNASFDTI